MTETGEKCGRFFVVPVNPPQQSKQSTPQQLKQSTAQQLKQSTSQPLKQSTSQQLKQYKRRKRLGPFTQMLATIQEDKPYVTNQQLIRVDTKGGKLTTIPEDNPTWVAPPLPLSIHFLHHKKRRNTRQQAATQYTQSKYRRPSHIKGNTATGFHVQGAHSVLRSWVRVRCVRCVR
jgi:hypothetical protein